MLSGINKLAPVIFFVAAIFGGNASSFAFQNSPDPPNIIFVLSDDHRWDAMGCAGNAVIKTPEMDRLAETGVRFTHTFVTTPICAASRASILTGRYERQHGYTFQKPPLSQSLIEQSYPTLMRNAGYQTGFVGKLGVKIPQGAAEKMFDFFRPTGLPYMKQNQKHLTERNTDLAIEFIESVNADNPFCLSLSFWAPHAEDSNPDQFVPIPAMESLYADETIPEPVLADKEFFQKLPDFQKQSLNRVRWAWRFDNPEKYQQMVKGYYRMISGIDQSIGRIRQKLETLGLADNTVIIVSGDNGYFLGERGFAGKWTMHDVSLRVPLIVYDPRLPKSRQGSVNDGLAINLDIPKTILDYAGIDLPDSYLGESLLPQIQVGDELDRQVVFTEHLWNHKNIPRTEAIRTNRWKYIRYLDHQEFEELYDLQSDRNEMDNLAESDQHQEILKELRTKCNIEAERIKSSEN